MLLVDASVWSALADSDDPYNAEAHSVVRDFSRDLAVLDLTLYEIANAVGVKMGRNDDARYLSQLVLARCRDRVVAVDPRLLESALEIAVEFDLTAYDAAYVAAARRHGWILVSTDIADLVSKGLAVAPGGADYP